MRKIFSPILFTFLLSTICACKNETLAKFEIVNATDETIDSIKIMPDNVINHYIQLQPNSKSNYTINMTNDVKADGSYGLFYKIKNRNMVKHFGYFSNGYPAESLTVISIYKDSIDIKPEYNKIF